MITYVILVFTTEFGLSRKRNENIAPGPGNTIPNPLRRLESSKNLVVTADHLSSLCVQYGIEAEVKVLGDIGGKIVGVSAILIYV